MAICQYLEDCEKAYRDDIIELNIFQLHFYIDKSTNFYLYVFLCGPWFAYKIMEYQIPDITL